MLESDTASYVSVRTLWNLRDIVAQHGLQDMLFENVTKALQKLFTLDPSKQRLDSVHIFSNMAHLGRIRILARTIRTFLTNLKRHHAKKYDALGEIKRAMVPLPSNLLNPERSLSSLATTAFYW
jgi:hypothetical protein